MSKISAIHIGAHLLASRSPEGVYTFQPTMSKPVKLTYFPGRGKSEVIRLILAAGGVEWEEEDMTTKERVEELRNSGVLMFQQFPLLEIDGLNLVQSMSISRYLATKYGFMGKSQAENVKIDMLAEGSRDWLGLGGFTGLVFQKPENCDKVKATSLEKSQSRYLPAFEKALKENRSNGFLVGDKLTLADLAFLDVLTWVWEFDEELVNKFPECKAALDNYTSIPKIAAYLKGEQRHGQPDEEYKKTVDAALNR